MAVTLFQAIEQKNSIEENSILCRPACQNSKNRKSIFQNLLKSILFNCFSIPNWVGMVAISLPTVNGKCRKWRCFMTQTKYKPFKHTKEQLGKNLQSKSFSNFSVCPISLGIDWIFLSTKDWNHRPNTQWAAYFHKSNHEHPVAWQNLPINRCFRSVKNLISLGIEVKLSISKHRNKPSYWVQDCIQIGGNANNRLTKSELFQVRK